MHCFSMSIVRDREWLIFFIVIKNVDLLDFCCGYAFRHVGR